MNLILLLYNFLFTTILGISAFLSANSKEDYLFATLFIPLSLYFGNRLFKFVLRRANLTRLAIAQRAAVSALNKQQTIELTTSEPAIEGEIVPDPFPIRDRDKRLFLKLIASSGLSLFLLSLFTKRTHAAFFGSVPGPGTVAIKDSSGNEIDPAEKQPTDGYEIAQIDDTAADYAYYGFVDKNGNWYITREDVAGADAGTYLYAAGTTGFSTNWTNRAGLSYASFDATF